MGFYKKTVLLTNQANYEKGMAILTIEQSGSGVFGSIKTFDIPKTGNLVLGITVDSKSAIKQNVIFANGNVFNFKLPTDFNINGKIGCVLVDLSHNEVNALVWGTNGNSAEYKKDIINVFNNDIKVSTYSEPKLAEKDIPQAKMEENKPTQDIDPKLFEDDENIEEIIDKEMGENDDFYGLISDQIDDLFNKFPSEERLVEIVPNSRWIKVDYDGDGKQYVLGLVYDQNEVKYICYGVPSDKDNAPPSVLESYSQWLETDDGGYWVMFQDAKTGENVIVDDVKMIN